MPNYQSVNAYRDFCQNYASALSINYISNVDSTNSIPSSDYFPWDTRRVSASIFHVSMVKLTLGGNLGFLSEMNTCEHGCQFMLFLM